jgi:hypothetical protein
MYRERIHLTVRDRDGWNVAVEVTAELNAICARLGVPTGTLWTETVGTFNQLTWEIDHPTLAAYEQTQATIRADEDWNKQVTRITDVAEPGKGWTELLETVTTV